MLYNPCVLLTIFNLSNFDGITTFARWNFVLSLLSCFWWGHSIGSLAGDNWSTQFLPLTLFQHTHPICCSLINLCQHAPYVHVHVALYRIVGLCLESQVLSVGIMPADEKVGNVCLRFGSRCSNYSKFLIHCITVALSLALHETWCSNIPAGCWHNHGVSTIIYLSQCLRVTKVNCTYNLAIFEIYM